MTKPPATCAKRENPSQDKTYYHEKILLLAVAFFILCLVLAGRYRHPVYGCMQIAIKDGREVATFPHHKGRYATVEPLGGNRYLAQFNEALYGNKVWLFTISNGKVKSVTVTVADFVEFTAYEFVKTN